MSCSLRRTSATSIGLSLTTNKDKSSTVLLSENETMMGPKIVFDKTLNYAIKVVLMIDTIIYSM